MNLELRHLRVVCAIADTGSVTKAASLLGLAQPALTAQLQRIERTLGGPLFLRDRRGARPTPLGGLVLARARVLLPAMQGLQDEAARMAGVGADASRFRIGAVAGSVVGGLVRRLTADLPEALVSTHPSWSREDLTQQLVAGRLDFALIGACGHPGPVGDVGLSWRQVAVDAVQVLLPTRHPLAGREEIELAELAGAHWVTAPGDGCFNDCFAATCARAGFTPQRIYEIDDRGALDLVEAGAAVALCRPTLRPTPTAVMRPLAGAPLRWRQLLGWHPQSEAAATSDQVFQYAVAAYQEAVERNPNYGTWLSRHPSFGVSMTTVS
ncbi:LysR family transcriptional regulator [Pilimelia columellifera]|uniref:LysR family transcriptional regulator n=1 Tax=Pilimelia columellifera subsp. columellifera TaxID=706583 RepID=A0ABP6AXE0_9ACTN